MAEKASAVAQTPLHGNSATAASLPSTSQTVTSACLAQASYPCRSDVIHIRMRQDTLSCLPRALLLAQQRQTTRPRRS